MLLHGTTVQGTGFALRLVENLAAAFIAAGALRPVKTARGAIGAAGGQPQDFPLLCFREIL